MWGFYSIGGGKSKIIHYITILYSLCLILWCLTPLSTIFQLYCISFIGGGNGGPGKNHRSVAGQNSIKIKLKIKIKTLSYNVVHLALIEIRTNNISGDRH